MLPRTSFPIWTTKQHYAERNDMGLSAERLKPVSHFQQHDSWFPMLHVAFRQTHSFLSCNKYCLLSHWPHITWNISTNWTYPPILMAAYRKKAWNCFRPDSTESIPSTKLAWIGMISFDISLPQSLRSQNQFVNEGTLHWLINLTMLIKQHWYVSIHI